MKPYAAYREAMRQAADARELARRRSTIPTWWRSSSRRRRAEERAAGLRAELEALLVPKDPNDGKDLIVEIRAGAGGEEAALWAGELFEMYRRLAERRRWKTEVLSTRRASSAGSRRR